jgi:hypothetical protein
MQREFFTTLLFLLIFSVPNKSGCKWESLAGQLDLQVWGYGSSEISQKIYPSKMKLPLHIFLFLIFMQVSSLAQRTDWQRTYGISGRKEECYSLTKSYDDGFLLVINVKTNNSPANYGAWLLKTDQNGLPLWSKYFYNPVYAFEFTNIEQDSFGDFIVTGLTCELNQNGDSFIMKLNPCGEKIWCKRLNYPGSDGNYGQIIKQITNFRYLWLTHYASNDWVSEGNQIWWIDSTGNVLSCVQILPGYNYPYLKTPIINNVLITSDSGYLLPGYGYIHDTASPQQWWRLQQALVKIDSVGIVEWMKPVDSLDLPHVGALQCVIEDNNYYYTVGYTKNLLPKWYPYCAKIGFNGQFQFETVMHSDTLLNTLIEIEKVNNYFIQIGQCFYTPTDPIFTGLFLTDTLGNLIKSLENKHGFAYPTAFTKSINNKFVIGGYAPYNYTSSGQIDAWAMKVNENLEYDSIYNFPFVYDSLCPFPIPLIQLIAIAT